MRITLLALLFITSTQASMEFNSGRTTKKPMIKKRIFYKVLNMMQEKFQFQAEQLSEKMVIYGGWVDPTADLAFARRWEEAQVLIYRGMAHRKEINTDALILIVCHELGHLYGGEPFKNPENHISPEGQADYFATKFCLRSALAAWNPQNIEKRAIEAILSVGKFLANNRDQDAPEIETPDLNSVQVTNMRHPAPQCRLDTYYAGLTNNPRPSCWYAP